MARDRGGQGGVIVNLGSVAARLGSAHERVHYSASKGAMLSFSQGLGREAVKQLRPMQPGDVTATYADISRLRALTGYQPKVSLEEGLPRFAQWWRAFYPA